MFADHIKGLKAAKQKALEEKKAILKKAQDEGRTLSENEIAELQERDENIATIDTDLKYYQDAMNADQTTAEPVNGDTQEAGQKSRQGTGSVRVIEPKLEKGVLFARLVKTLARAKGSASDAIIFAENDAKKTNDNRLLNLVKAAVAPATTQNTEWAGALTEGKEASKEFIELLLPETILGKFGTNGIPSLREIPFNVLVPGQSLGGSATWVGEGKAASVTTAGFFNTKLDRMKLSAISVLTEEMILDSSPAADILVRDTLIAAISSRIDKDFIDPTKTESARLSPASITNKGVAIESVGNNSAAIKRDAVAMHAPFIKANIPTDRLVWLMGSSTALTLSLMTTQSGAPAFPGMTPGGGFFLGKPVIVSSNIGKMLILADAASILIAKDDDISVKYSQEANIKMSSDPENDSGAESVSMFQNDMVAIKTDQYINWSLARSGSVSYIKEVNWTFDDGAPGK